MSPPARLSDTHRVRARWWCWIVVGLLVSLTATVLAATLAADLAVGRPRTAPVARISGPDRAAAAVSPAQPSPAVTSAALSDAERTWVRLVNRDRAAAGLPAYEVADDLVEVSRSWSSVLAQTGELAHNPRLSRQVTGYQVAGENVGYGPDAATIQAAFLNSPSHRANIMNTAYTEVGIAVTRTQGGRLWVVQVFRQPAGR